MSLVFYSLLAFFVFCNLHVLLTLAYYYLFPEPYHNAPSSRANCYAIYENNRMRGLVMGSIHHGINQTQMQPALYKIDQHLSQITQVFTEVEMVHDSLLQDGFEKYIVKKCYEKDIAIAGLEYRESEIALFSDQLIIASRQIPSFLPYYVFHRYPALAPLISIARDIALIPLNLMIILGSFIVEKIRGRAPENLENDDMERIKEAWSAGLAIGYSTTHQSAQIDHLNSAYLKQRDHLYAGVLDAYLQKAPTHFCVAVVGTAHLSEHGAIIDELALKGYELRPEPIRFSIPIKDKPVLTLTERSNAL